MRESDAVESARRALGAQLAACRRAAGYSQAALGAVVGYSRSTIANVETGRQHVPRDFWAHADDALHAEGMLAEGNDEILAAVQRERQGAARGTRPLLVALATGYGAGAAPSAHGSGAAVAPGAPGNDDGWSRVVAVAANEAREHAERAAVTQIGPGTVEQLTADVIRLGRAYVSAPPLPLFAAMHHALSRVQAMLDLRTYPAQARDLSFLGGTLCGLMANACLDLGREDAADDLARAAWTYGRIIDHSPLMGWARGTQALAAIWDERYADAIRHAEEGLRQVAAGTGSVRLHAIHARALAAHGDWPQAREAITAAGRFSPGTGPDDLHDGIGGEFAFGEPKLRYYQALTLNDADDPATAEPAAAAAVRLYQALPPRARSYGCDALARVQLARAQLMNDKLDDAAQALAGVLALDPQLRIGSLRQHLDTCGDLLRRPSFRSSATARRLEQQITAFSGVSAAQALPSGR